MASWKKIITSGSAAELSSLTLDTALPVAQGGTGATSLADKAVLISQDSGTDAIGALALTTNGALIVGGSSGPAVEAPADVAGTGLDAATGDGTLAINVAAAQTSITSIINSSLGKIGTAADQEYITFGTSNEVNAFVNNTERLSVTATGANVTGNFEASVSSSAEHIAGVTISGSFQGDGSGLTGVGTDIDTLSALGGTGLHQTQDHFIFSDNGTEKKITFSNLEDAIFGNVSGDATIAAGGALTIAADSVENSMLANITRGSVKVGGGSNAPTDLDAKTDGQILVGDGTDINSVAVSGDATLANDGAVTIANDAVTNAKLANIARGSVKVGGGSNAPTDLNAKGDGKILVGDGTDVASVSVSGDVALSNTGAVTIQANAVEGSMLNANTVDDATIEIDSNAIQAKTAAIANGGAALATADQIHTFYTAGGSDLATALNTDLGGNFTIGNQSSDTATFTGGVSVGQGLTVTGDLTVNGTTTMVSSSNLKIQDKFMFLASGSGAGTDGGFIVQSGSAANSGSAMYHDINSQRWAVAKSVGQSDVAIVPTNFVATVSSSTSNPTNNNNHDQNYGAGEMVVNTSTGEIWIRT